MIAYIDMYKHRFGVEPICRTLGATESGFLTSRGYRAAKTRPVCHREVRDRQLLPVLREVHANNYGVYGKRKMWHALRRQGWMIGREQTGRLMRKAGLQGIRRGRKPMTTCGSKTVDARLDLVDRKFTAVGPNRLWVADITYVRTRRIPVVVATVNTYAGSSKAAIRSAGVSQPSDFRGRPFSSSAIMASCSNVNWRRSAPLGRY